MSTAMLHRWHHLELLSAPQCGVPVLTFPPHTNRKRSSAINQDVSPSFYSKVITSTGQKNEHKHTSASARTTQHDRNWLLLFCPSAACYNWGVYDIYCCPPPGGDQESHLGSSPAVHRLYGQQHILSGKHKESGPQFVPFSVLPSSRRQFFIPRTHKYQSEC